MSYSSSSSVKPIKHEVFLSFRGADTRNNFTSHLYDSLCRQGIVTFIDNRLERGEEIEPAILKAIEDSYISVIILSKDFASSPWCLDELVKIFECRDLQGQKVIPVFYHVDPTEVDSQTGNFGEALTKLEEDFKENMDKVRKWRIVLSRAANIAGELMTDSRLESELIEIIVKEILKYFRYHHSHYFKNLVGIQLRVSQVESLLCIGSSDVRIIGIWGMGGIGKTTVAKVVYEKYASQFEGCCFLENIRDHNLSHLQNELLLQILSEGNINSRLMFRMRQLRYKRSFIVLDNVDDYEQIEHLANEHNWFGAGSRIIITSRDKSVFQDRVDGIYEVKALTDQEALYLFSLFAFKENSPTQDHMDLSINVVSYARGNPLALKILGLFLYGKNKEEWRSELKRLQKFPDKKIQKILKISYDGLDADHQQIFLHIACFFKRESITRVINLLDACGYSTLIGLRVLADKSLIIMSNGKLDMHDLLQEMGRQIVVQESKEPGKRSRLWNHEDIYHVLMKNTGSGAIEGICLDKSKLELLSLHPQVFVKMNEIKLLKFHNSGNNVDNLWCFEEFLRVSNNVVFPEGLEYLPNELRLLQWQFYPEKSLPSKFQPGNLVEINLSGSCIERLWEGVQEIPDLKEIKLRHCKQLIKMPNFSRAPNLEKIDCAGCISLVEVCPSISCLNNLEELILSNCYKITSVPSTKNLTSLFLSNCPLNNFPEVPTTIQRLFLNGTKIEEIPCSVLESLSQLKRLSLLRCKRLKYLPSSVSQLRHLEYLGCGPYLNLWQLESNIGLCLLSLRCLHLLESELESIPSSIQQMSWLEELDLSLCKRLLSLPKLPSHLQRLTVSQCTSLTVVSDSLIGLKECWGMFFFANCTNLNQKEIRSILIHAHQRILHLAHTPRFKLHTEPDKSINNIYGDLCEQLVVIFPGNNIPEWIQHQSTGCSITIPLPPNWYHNFLGFAVGIVLELGKYTYYEIDYNRVWLDIQFKSNRVEETYYIPATFSYQDYRTNSSGDQVVLWYHNNFSFKDKDQTDHSMFCYNEVMLEFVVEDSQLNPLPSSMIKKCGVRLLYNGDHNNDEDDVIIPIDDENNFVKESCFKNYSNYVGSELCFSDTVYTHQRNGEASVLGTEQTDVESPQAGSFFMTSWKVNCIIVTFICLVMRLALLVSSPGPNMKLSEGFLMWRTT